MVELSRVMLVGSLAFWLLTGALIGKMIGSWIVAAIGGLVAIGSIVLLAG